MAVPAAEKALAIVQVQMSAVRDKCHSELHDREASQTSADIDLEMKFGAPVAYRVPEEMEADE